jgi:hypothetical protein
MTAIMRLSQTIVYFGTYPHLQSKTKFPTGKYKQVSGMSKIPVNGKQKIPIGTSITLRKKNDKDEM